MKKRTKRLFNGLALLGLRGALAVLGRTDVVRCSNLGGFLARRVGPRLPVSRVADANLRCAMPELDRAGRRRIIAGSWDNLGRTAFELTHLAELRRTASGPGWEVEGETHLREALARDGRVMIFSGHLGNWELTLPIAVALGLQLAVVYRAASDPGMDEMIQAARRRGQAGGVLHMFPKGADGARLALRHVSAGGSLAMLIDQKMNDGIAVPFFGRPAMTAPALAQFALRFACPPLPARVRRVGPARFRLVWEPPLPLPPRQDRVADILALTTAMNATLERWIREEPQAWLWMHRRWPTVGGI